MPKEPVDGIKKIPLHISQAFNLEVSENGLDFFDANLEFDTKLFLDPFLIKRSPIKSEAILFDGFGSFFKYVYDKSIKVKTEARAIVELGNLLTFHEPREINLGYTENSNKGSGPGSSFAASLFHFFLKSSAKKIVIEDHLYPDKKFNPSSFALFLDRVGQDGISDITANLLMDYLIQYTQTQCKKWKIKTKILPVQQVFDWSEMKWTNGLNVYLPENPIRPGEPIVFVPKRFLRSEAYQEKANMRNRIIGILRLDPDIKERFADIIFKPIEEISTQEIRTILEYNHSLLKQYFERADKDDINPYDFIKDTLGFLDIKNFFGYFKALKPEKLTDCKDLLNITTIFINGFKTYLEHQGGWKDMWDSILRTPQKEEVLGRRFRAMGISYFLTYPDITFDGEVDVGVGKMDFRVIYKSCRIAMELKKLSNSQSTGKPPLPAYLHGIMRQLPDYAISNKVKYAFYLTGQHFRSTEKGERNDDGRAAEIRGKIMDVITEIKQSLPNFVDLRYFNFDISPKKSASKR